ncbi:MAG: Sodium/iodide co-transporter [Cytophagales bacterium]|jgi:SSS family transporter|nr:sodium:solute symporter [Bacteroidota bacterium]MBS1982272.1 sodium:solute symporter [Bacteroidota bacterium]WHZ07634.1 MAG: Sodium/iodide co-transporter [Cytophagales bacterium]
MSPFFISSIILIYFAALITISYFTSKGADSNTFFTANRQSPWYLVAFGMIGSSLSGVTFVSVPGAVGKVNFAYFQVVLGYLAGYVVIITILMPLYYKLKVVSIYTYLEQRFDSWSHKTGAAVFLVSRSMASSLRLFLAASILQLFLFDAWNIPFYATVLITIALIWIYTFKGGVKTIIWTDTFQTIFLVGAVIITVWQISIKLNFSFSEMVNAIHTRGYSKIFILDSAKEALYFPKQFLGGMFITIAMTGLDQELMQKNLTCKTLGDAQKNMFWFSITLVIVNLLFLTLGALLYIYCEQKGIAIPKNSDDLFPMLAFNELGLLVGVLFLLGITASSYASADSALAGLTTSFCIDFLNFKAKEEKTKQRQKFIVHLSFSALFLIIILIFKEVNQKSLIDAVLKVAGYTYGPLLGLFAFGIFTTRNVNGKFVPAICILAPLLSYLLSTYSEKWFNGYQMSYEVIIIDGLITFLGLWLISTKEKSAVN